MILLTTITTKIQKVIKPEDDIRFLDVRYLDKWIRNYPQCFPKFVLNNEHKILFNPNKLRYEFHK
jgi:hypothetical protein